MGLVVPASLQLAFGVMGPGLRRDDTETVSQLLVTRPRSRDVNRPSFASRFALLSNRGRRESRVPIAPMGPEQQKSSGGRTTGVTGKHSGFPCAMVVRLLSCSPRRDRACLSPSPAKMLSPLCEETPATGASGPHDFTVRLAHPRQSRARASTASRPNTRDDREAPLKRVRRADHRLSWSSEKQKYFVCEGLPRRANQCLAQRLD